MELYLFCQNACPAFYAVEKKKCNELIVLKTKKYKFKCDHQLKAFSVTNRASCQSV